MTDKPTTATRRERIVVLLENYLDVEAGLRDRGVGGEHIPLMCAAYNHPSFQELKRLLGLMQDYRRQLYWHLAQTYFYSTRRQVLQCPRCRGIQPTWSSANFHKHGHSNVAIVPRVVRVVRVNVDDQHVSQAIEWIDERWQGEVFLPDELLPAVA